MFYNRNLLSSCRHDHTKQVSNKCYCTPVLRKNRHHPRLYALRCASIVSTESIRNKCILWRGKVVTTGEISRQDTSRKSLLICVGNKRGKGDGAALAQVAI